MLKRNLLITLSALAVMLFAGTNIHADQKAPKKFPEHLQKIIDIETDHDTNKNSSDQQTNANTKVAAIKDDDTFSDTSDENGTTNTGKDFSSIQNVLNDQMGKPYTWGATGPKTFDCSGLTQYVFKHALNKSINRTAEQQYNQFKHVKHSDVKPGDLVFFSYNGGKTIDHVGIIVKGNNMMVDAQDRGVIRETYMSSWWRGYIAGYARVVNFDK
ncbi:C40 family peptidase [Pediococcus argentinicus]|uniref:Cell wall-associated hydrolase n=1 Tax=Pediococcus argentinicus TaxID=480391 RepID=A0A0R2NJL1_9LACO|nr:NlpC/P60 family protein [Pediococcus argentinicus]KRO25967.1 cell wall-associated hydrolase [Pediococcus argentinicus]GEP18958.1 hypothetical protein LSA03_03420 [Pediococcus argentinicus]